MRMNSNTILAGRGVNALAALDAGNRARAFQEDAQFQNALRPMQMESAQLGVQQQRQNLQLGQEQIANLRRQAAAAASAAQDKATLAREYEQAQNGMKMALTALTTGDEQAWNQVAAGFGMPGLPMDESGARALDAVLSGIGEGLGLGAAIPETPKPGNDYERYAARERAAGRQPLDEFAYREQIRGPGEMATVELADGTKVSVGTATGTGGGGAVDLSSPGAFIDKLDATLNDPALDWATGALAWTQYAPGTPMRRFKTRADQLSGTAFMQARDALKGGGQITDFEGQRAEDAIARLDTAQAPQDYRDALLELRSILVKGMQRQRGWVDTQEGKIMQMNAADIDALDLTKLSAAELAAARDRLLQLADGVQ